MGLWRPDAPATVFALPNERNGQSNTTVSPGGERALVMIDGLPSWLIDLQDGAVRSVPAASLAVRPGAWIDTVGAPGGRYWIGSDSGLPVWWLDAASATLVSLDPGASSSMRPFTAASYCAGRPHVLADGRMGVALRDDIRAAWHLGSPGAWSERRLGLPVTGVGALYGTQLGDGVWALRGATLKDTYCPVAAQMLAWSEPAGSALVGDSLQVVSEGGEPFVLSRDQESLIVDATGGCVLARGGDLIDARAGVRRSIGPFLAAWWLGGSSTRL